MCILFELNPIRKRSIRFVEEKEIGVGLFGEQIKHEDRRYIDKKATKENMLRDASIKIDMYIISRDIKKKRRRNRHRPSEEKISFFLSLIKKESLQSQSLLIRNID